METRLGNYKVLLIDSNLELINKIASFFKQDKIFAEVDLCEDGVLAYDKIKSNTYDVIITDLILPNMDGFLLLEKLQELHLIKKPKIIAISSLSSDGFITKAMSMGVDYFMLKPINEENLKTRTIDLLNGQNLVDNKSKEQVNKNKALEEKITNIFITVGIPAHIKGYQFLREAIKMAIASPDIINSITKKLYPSIAERFDTSSSKVERAIRHAIEVAWNRGKIENINNLFGLKVYTSNEKPTNGEFIALVADKMLIEGA